MLHVISKQDAVDCVLHESRQTKPRVNRVSISQALGRVLAVDIISEENVPSFDRSTVDGYAVIASDTFGAGETMPAELTVTHDIRMGEAADCSLSNGFCARIATGGMLPKHADAVVMVEHTQNEEDICLIYASVSPGENITRCGDDVSVGTLVLKKGTRISAPDVGVLASLGYEAVPVFQRPVVAVVSTGDELTSGVPKAGQVRDINSDLLSAAAKEAGCDVRCFGAVRDDAAQIRAALADCLADADIVLLSGGSSAGTKDMTVQILNDLGIVHFHGIAMKPGKPTIFATVDGKPVFGLPGHPLAAYFVFRLIVCPLIRSRLCLPPARSDTTGILSFNLPSNHGREEYLCIAFDQNGGVVPLHTKSGVISVLTKADGYICVPRNTEGLPAGSMVEVYSL